jgi:hypothetical protein
MIVRHASIALLALSLALSSSAIFAADKVSQVPVHFAKGQSATALKGSFKGYDTVEYLLTAKAGQVLSVKVSGSSNANLNVFPPVDYVLPDPQQLALPLEGTDTRSARLPADGLYRIQVYQPRASARRGAVVKYSLKIEVR